MNIKRQPTLADRLLALEPKDYKEPRFIAGRQNLLVQAKKFVLDAQATVYLARMLKEHPRIVSDANDFAQRPFEQMWIEMPFPAFYEIMTGRKTDSDGDQIIGYLFDGPVVNVASFGAEGVRYGKSTPAGFTPVEYILNRPMSETETEKVCAQLGMRSHRGFAIDIQMWGSSALSFVTDPEERARLGLLNYVEDRPDREWDAEGLRSLRENHTLRIRKIPGVPDEDIKDVVQGSSGDLRNIIALLLFLNRTANIQSVREEPMGHAMINRRPRPLLPHKVISLRIDPGPRLLKLVADQEHIKRCNHPVRGHYKHDKRAWAGCPHGKELAGDFGEWWIEYEPLRWKCEECGGKRWWHPAHRRGDPALGVIDRDYAVTSHRTTPEALSSPAAPAEG